MAQVIDAVFDGDVLIPTEPAELQRDRRYRLIVQEPSEETAGKSAWDILDDLCGSVEMPPDWSEEHDHYLYGTPKRNPGP